MSQPACKVLQEMCGMACKVLQEISGPACKVLQEMCGVACKELAGKHRQLLCLGHFSSRNSEPWQLTQILHWVKLEHFDTATKCKNLIKSNLIRLGQLKKLSISLN